MYRLIEKLIQKLQHLRIPLGQDLERFVPACLPEHKEAFAFSWMAVEAQQKVLANTRNVLDAEKEAANPPVSADNGEKMSPPSVHVSRSQLPIVITFASTCHHFDGLQSFWQCATQQLFLEGCSYTSDANPGHL